MLAKSWEEQREMLRLYLLDRKTWELVSGPQGGALLMRKQEPFFVYRQKSEYVLLVCWVGVFFVFQLC